MSSETSTPSTVLPSATPARRRPTPDGLPVRRPHPRAPRRQRRLRAPRRRDPADLRRDHGLHRDPSRPGPSRAGRRPRGRGLRLGAGKVGVAMATSGPGATNLVTAIMDAHMDSVPVVFITGQVFSTLMGTDAFQEADIVGITMPITKHSFLVTDAADIPSTIAAAYHIAGTGRPGPVLVDITKDAQQNAVPFVWPPKIDLPGIGRSRRRTASRSWRLRSCSPRPRSRSCTWAAGSSASQASEELLELAEVTGAPVTTTLMARGAFPDSHKQHLGMPGMHGTVPAVLALQESDLIVSLGARFDDRVTGNTSTVRAERQDRARRRRPCRDLQDPHRRRPHRRRCQGRHRRSDRRLSERGQRRPAGHRRVVDVPERAPRGVPARLRPRPRRPARAAACDPAHRRADRARGHLRRGRRPAPDVGRAVHQVRASERVAELGRCGHHGLLGAGRDGRQGRPARPRRLGDRRRRMLPDDQPGTRHLHDQRHPDQGGDHQQLVARHGAPVADAVLRRAATRTPT